LLRFSLKFPTAATCGRYFVRGMLAFWIILLLFLLLPAEPVWLLQLVIGCWLVSFVITFGSYLLLILRRIGVLPADDEGS
jgi:hypothetical protein